MLKQLKMEDHVFEDPREIASGFNDYFVTLTNDIYKI